MAKKNVAAATSRQSAAPPVEYASAMDKLRDEMAESRDNYVQVVGEYLTGYLLDHPEAEAALMEKGKSISGSLKVVREEASKVKQGNVAILDDRTVYGIVLGYFGLKSEAEMPKTGENVPNMPGNVLNMPGNVLERHADQKPSPGASAEAGEDGSPRSGETKEVVPHPDPFDLDALLGVMG